MSFVRWAAVGTALVSAVALAAESPAPRVKGRAGTSAEIARTGAASSQKREATGAEAARKGPTFRYALELDQDTRFRMADQKRDEAIEQLEKDILPKFEKRDPERPDLMFQLSEYYWEKFKYLYALEEKKNEAALRKYDAARARGEKVGNPPKVDHTESELYRARTMKLYEEILADHPKFEKTDAVLFALGSNLQDLSFVKMDPKLRDQAAKRYEDLIKRFPQSRLVGDTHVQLGDYYFDNNKLEPATKSYEQALGSKVPKVYSYALYKLAWCDFNRNEFEKGLKKLHQVVDFAEKQGRKMVDLKNEALNDAVLFYTQLDQPNEAMAYFGKKAEPARHGKLVGRLAEQLAIAGYYDDSTKVYRHLIKENPLRPEAPVLQNGIIDNFEKLRQRKAVKEEIKLLAESYRPGGKWWEAQQGNKAVLKDAFEVTEEATRKIVTDYHQEAQKTEQVETFRLARDLYKQYLDAFASSPDENFVSDFAFNMRFYYAQILWGLEEWEPSAAAYDAVVAQKIPNRPEAQEIAKPEYRKIAAYNAILAYDKLLKIERGELEQRTLKDGQKIRDDKDKGGMSQVAKVERKEVKGARPVDLTRIEKKMVAACDAYTRLDEKLKESKDEVDIRYQAAVILYDKNHFDEAATRFSDIIKGWPEAKRSEEAADLTLFILEGLERWEDLKDTSSALLANKRLARAGTPFARRLATIAEKSHYKWIDEVVNKQQKNPEKAAEEFLAFAKAHPRSKTADRALVYSMLLLRDQADYDRAIQAGERVLSEYKGSPFEPKVHFTLAALYEKVAHFEKAAESYEGFLAAQDRRARAFDELKKKAAETKKKGADEEVLAELDERVAVEKQLLDEATAWRADAQFNAGAWWEGLGQTDKAIASFRAYLKNFADRKDVPEVHLRIAALQERDKQWSAAIRTYEEFERRYGRDKRTTPDQLFNATYRQFAGYLELKRTRDAERAQREVVARWAKLPQKDKDALPLVISFGHARFSTLEPLYREYEAIKLKNVRTLQRDLKAKQKKLGELEKGYVEVVKLGAGEHSIAAVIRLGQAYEDLARNILESPTPGGLDEDQQQMYRAELENLATPLEEKALEAYEGALAKSYELGLYGDWVVAAQEKVNGYKPGAYAQLRTVDYRGVEFFGHAEVLDDVTGMVTPAQTEKERGAPAEPPAAAEQEKKVETTAAAEPTAALAGETSTPQTQAAVSGGVQ